MYSDPFIRFVVIPGFALDQGNTIPGKSYITKRGGDNIQLILLPKEDYVVHADRIRGTYQHFVANRRSPPYDGVCLNEPTEVLIGGMKWLGIEGFKQFEGKCVMWQWELIATARTSVLWVVVTTAGRHDPVDFEPFVASVSENDSLVGGAQFRDGL